MLSNKEQTCRAGTFFLSLVVLMEILRCVLYLKMNASLQSFV